MNDDRKLLPTGPEYPQPPFLYEIHVKGRLSGEQWADWFEDLTVSTAQGESTLGGSAPDHAALYGLLARLRDLAIPLISVKVLDADAQGRLARQSRRYDLLMNGLLAAIYLLVVGSLAAITVFVAPIINTALAMALLFALVGGLAYGFWLWSGQPAWRWIAYGAWPAAWVSFAIYIPVSGLLPPALGIAILLLLLAGALVVVVSRMRRRAEEIRARLFLPGVPSAAPEAVDPAPDADASRSDTPGAEGGS
jgi:hypothetical protein